MKSKSIDKIKDILADYMFNAKGKSGLSQSRLNYHKNIIKKYIRDMEIIFEYMKKEDLFNFKEINRINKNLDFLRKMDYNNYLYEFYHRLNEIYKILNKKTL